MKNKTLNIKIENLTEAQAIALEDIFTKMVQLGSIGSSRWVCFYADGDGNFQPKISINDETPKHCALFDTSILWKEDKYMMDFDIISQYLRGNAL